jgi:WD40 repeat protein
MERRTAGARLGERAAARRRKTARRVSMICGLGLAAVTSAVMYVALPASSAPSSDQTYLTITLRQVRSFPVAGKTSSVQLSPDGKIVVGITDHNRIYAFSVSTRQQLITGVDDGIPPAARQFDTPVFGPGGNTFAVLDSNISTFEGGGFDIWKSGVRRAPLLLLPHSGSNSGLWATPGPNKLVAYTYGGQPIGLADIKTGRSDGELLGGESTFRITSFGPERQTAFSPNGKIIAASDGKGLMYLWNVASRRVIATLAAEKLFNDTANSNPISSPDIDSIIFSLDSKAIACGSGSGIVRVWNVATRHNIVTFSVNGDDPFGAAARPVWTLIFSPDGKRLVAADSAGVLGIWNVASGHKIATITTPGGNFESVAFTKAGALLVATENDSASAHKIEIWTSEKNLAAMLARS